MKIFKIPKASTDFYDWDNKPIDEEYGQNELNQMRDTNEGYK